MDLNNSADRNEFERLAMDHLEAMATGDAELAEACLTADHVNHMADDEPPACARPGVPGFLATSAWLRLAFSDLRFEVIEIAADTDRTIAHVKMSGTQIGPFVVFPQDGRPVAFPPTGRSFQVRQCHVFRTAGYRHCEHIAVRDDLGMMTALGHLPPSPAAAFRLARWKASGRAKRAVAEALRVAEAAASDGATLLAERH